MADSPAPATTPDDDELLSRFNSWDKLIDAHWNPWAREMRECYELREGRQWSETDEKELIEAKRLAPVFNRIGPLLDAVSGAEIMGRQEAAYYPRSVGKSGVNQLLTKAAGWIRDRCDADMEESEAFRDAFTCGMGWTETLMDYDEEPGGQVMVERVDPGEMRGDPSARKGNLVDGRYVRRRKAMPYEVFDEEFPDHAVGSRSAWGSDSRAGLYKTARSTADTSADTADGGTEDEPRDGELHVYEYQWFERRPVWMIEKIAAPQEAPLEGDMASAGLMGGLSPMGPPMPQDATLAGPLPGLGAPMGAPAPMASPLAMGAPIGNGGLMDPATLQPAGAPDYEPDPELQEVDDETYQAALKEAEALAKSEDPEEREEGEYMAAVLGDAVRQFRRHYFRAFVAGNVILNRDKDGGVEELREGEFTYKCITGKRDRNKGSWYGLVRPMKDPQKWANTFLSQLLVILAGSSKGGVFIESDAVENMAKFEESFAKPNTNTQVLPGTIAENKILPKPATQYPQGIDRLLEMSISALHDTTGINPELLGLVNREQAGVLEEQRKRAAYGILSVFFDNFRRYRRVHGRLLLRFIRYLPDNYLVRIAGEDGTAEYIPIVKARGDAYDVAKFDVIVDEAPASPNQKSQTFGILMQLLPMLKDAGLPPTFWAEVALYLPLPESLTQKMAAALKQGGEPQPPPPPTPQEAAEIDETNASAAQKRASALKDVASIVGEATAAGVVFPPDQQLGEVPSGPPAQ